MSYCLSVIRRVIGVSVSRMVVVMVVFFYCGVFVMWMRGRGMCGMI